MAEHSSGERLPYDFVLPPERIAQRPVKPYHAAKLLIDDGERIAEGEFIDLPRYIAPDDLFVFNDSRVIPARLFGKLPTGGAVEVLLLEKRDPAEWLSLGKPLKKLKLGTEIFFPQGLVAEVIDRPESQRVVLRFRSAGGADSVPELIRRVGVMPVPPYIRGGRGDEADREDYQTSFGVVEGSVAAPTASLHFTPELLDRIRGVGCGIEHVTLHVGAPSFTAVWSDEAGSPEIIPPGSEIYRIDRRVLRAIESCRARGGRVIGVGTTVVRALESMVRNEVGEDGAWSSTTLFIRPGFEFKTVDRLVTNFHQPRSTHLLLVEAFIGGVAIDRIYSHALRGDYRFFSYGDGMLLTRGEGAR